MLKRVVFCTFFLGFGSSSFAFMTDDELCKEAKSKIKELEQKLPPNTVFCKFDDDCVIYYRTLCSGPVAVNMEAFYVYSDRVYEDYAMQESKYCASPFKHVAYSGPRPHEVYCEKQVCTLNYQQGY